MSSKLFSNLIAVRVFLDNGTSYETNVNASCSDKTIQNYFVGQPFVRADEKTIDFCVKIEIKR